VKVLVWQMEGESPLCLGKECSGSGHQIDSGSLCVLPPPHCGWSEAGKPDH
jgi:hypothetical protein